MNTARYIGYDLKHALLNVASFFYLLVMPVGFYLLFGAFQSYSDIPMRDGNASTYVMLGMAIYGAVVGALSSAGEAVVEIEQGWGRQLALTPLSRAQHMFTKFVNALVTTALPVLAVNTVGTLTGSEIPFKQQVLCALVTVLAASVFAFFGTAIALLFKNARAVNVAAGLVVFMAFFGTVFSPPSPELLEVSRFTPLYGVAQLSRYFFTSGDIVTTSATEPIITDPISYALLNFAAWAIIFLGASILLHQKGKERS